MFQLASYVGSIRQIVRPGLMWFIRDPNDPEFQPLNEIISRPVLVQLRKLLIGTVMYAVIILGVFGGVVGTINFIGVLPLKRDLYGYLI